MTARTWIYRQDDVNSPPAPSGHLLALLDSKQLRESSWVWTAGLSDWAPASNLYQLVHVFEREEPPPLPPTPSRVDPLKELWRVIRAPFRSTVAQKVWWFSLLQFIPLVGSVFNRGWRLEMMARPKDNPFPPKEDIGRLLVLGILLWMMYGLYLLPELIFLVVFDRFSAFLDMIELLGYIGAVVKSGVPGQGLGDIVSGTLLGFLARSGFLIFYPIVTWPFFRVAMMRYARDQQNVSVFFDFVGNFRIIRRHYPVIMRVYVEAKLLIVAAFLAGSAVTGTGVGFLLVPAVIAPARVIASGLLYRDSLGPLVWATEPREPSPESHRGQNAGVTP
ncbi:MAG: DUF4013 domain-containing protein [Acidobacteriota bacterium]|nr:DUF4013 domain-containing protein [Acidobacteriota bacterium]